MRTFFLATVALGVLAMASPVAAADMPARGASPFLRTAPPAFSWSGFYVGLYGGAGWGSHDRSNDAGFNNSYKSSGGLIGGLAGYNWQGNNPLVVGVEGDLAWAGIKGDDGGAGLSVNTSHYRWLGSVRGRIGYAFDNWLLFGTGGWAFTNIRHTNDNAAGESFDSARSGWTVGGGIEYALTPNWTTRLDYRYFDFGSYSRPAPTNGIVPYSVGNRLQTITVGLSYKF